MRAQLGHEIRLPAVLRSLPCGESRCRLPQFCSTNDLIGAQLCLCKRAALRRVLSALFPTLRMAFFCFRHAQENAPAFLVPLTLGQIAISLRGLDFSLPVALGDFDRLLSILRITRLTFVAHKLQSAGSNAGLIAGSSLALSCC